MGKMKHSKNLGGWKTSEQKDIQRRNIPGQRNNALALQESNYKILKVT